MKKIISIALILVVIVSAFSTITASAATITFPGISESAYCEFTATKTIPVYRDSSCTTRGTSSPAQSYNAEIWNGDVCQMISLTMKHSPQQRLRGISPLASHRHSGTQQAAGN